MYFTNRVNPSNPDSIYSYYEDKSTGNTYLVVSGTLKNIHTEEIENPVDIEAVYQGKYKYDGFAVIEEADGSEFDIFGYVEPLSTRKFHYLITVPNEVETGGESLVVRFECGMCGYQEYQLIVR